MQVVASAATDLTAFNNTTCAIISGVAKCWGENAYGKLGDGSMTNRSTPTNVALPGGFTPSRLAAGEDFTCALSTGGAVRCWGKNDYGQLGDNQAASESATPVQTSGLTSGVTVLAAGATHACVVHSGVAKCWGSNLYGEQGNGASGTGQYTPGNVTGLTGFTVTSFGLGQYTSCATASQGGTRCWGRGYDGELGNGMSGFNADSTTPVQVTGVTSGSTAVSVGYGFACGVASGSAKCWGSNVNYVLGHNMTPSDSSATPVQVTGLTSGVTSIAASCTDHACAVVSGAVKCWGSPGPFLGTGDDDTQAPAPVSVVSLP